MRESGTIADRGKDYLEKNSAKTNALQPKGPSPRASNRSRWRSGWRLARMWFRETIRREGGEQLHRTASALGWSALAVGLSMRFSFIAEAC
jgi:hypothetical protein